MSRKAPLRMLGQYKKPRTKSRDLEHKEQCAFFDWCRLNENKYPQLKWIFAIPNQGRRNPTIGARFKREGMKAGVSDVFVPVPFMYDYGDSMSGGLFIEFKYGKNKLTDAQKDFQEEMQAREYDVAVVYSSEEAIELVKNYLQIK